MYIIFRFADTPNIGHEVEVSSLAIIKGVYHLTFKSVRSTEDFWNELPTDDGLRFKSTNDNVLTVEAKEFEMLFVHTVDS